MAQDKSPLPFRYKDKPLMEHLLKDVRLAISDSDALEEKEIVNRFLHRVSEAVLFVTIGGSGVGKSTFLNQIFASALSEHEVPESTKSIREFRYGVSEASVRVNEHVTRIFKSREELEGLQIIDMQGIEQAERDGALEYVKEYLYKSSVVFVLFDVRSVNDYAVWELLEEIETRKAVFVLTKCDLAEPETIQEREGKLRKYMEEAGIKAPVFKVSTQWEGSLKEVREYVLNEVTGSSPTLTSQQENLNELKNMLGQLSDSFERRRQQYESDALILKNISVSMDTFILNNREKIEDLKAALRREIEQEIEAYKSEVINRLDPQKIKERFPNGSKDIEDYLNLINEGYRKRMTDNVNRKTQMTVQAYLTGLERVLEEATGYLNRRADILTLKDRFYGSMAESRKEIAYRASVDLEVAKDYYHSLYDASTELFLKLWMAREERDRTIRRAKLAGTAVGTAGGAAAGTAVAHTVAPVVTDLVKLAMGKILSEDLTKAVAMTLNIGGGVLWPLVGTIVGALVIRGIAQKIADAHTLQDLEKKTKEAVGEFKDEVAKTKAAMTEQILETIEQMFRMEIGKADKCFVEFRMSVNIEGNNIARLEDKFAVIRQDLIQIKELEGESGDYGYEE